MFNVKVTNLINQSWLVFAKPVSRDECLAFMRVYRKVNYKIELIYDK